MKHLFALVVVTLSFATIAVAYQLKYDLEVNGMVCAYCAYNVSKQLGSVDGIVSKSVDVDVDQRTVKLRSEKELDKTQFADLLLQAGFELEAVSETVALTRHP